MAGTVVAAAGASLGHLFSGARAESPARPTPRSRFGPLRPDPSGILELPMGFECQAIDRAGVAMSDGFRVPALPDGMACFPGPGGSWVLMRNHEVDQQRQQGPLRDGQVQPSHAFDSAFHGGVTRVVIDPNGLKATSRNLALIGTSRNCAGGTSPWGWLSCEESLSPGHGYVFVCDPDAGSLTPPKCLRAYGKFRHEAASVDPNTSIAYLTEDEPDSCFYRFVPHATNRPFEGKLQALRVARARFDTGLMQIGETHSVDWVDIDDPEGSAQLVRYQAQAHGAAIFRRGEGLWLSAAQAYICATAGGPIRRGQVFSLDLRDRGAKLELLTQSVDAAQLDMPDNISVAPWGDVVLAEDNVFGEKHLRVLAPDGSLATLAKNRLSRGEFAGVCFSPDSSTLFVNLQNDGLTLAIRGPFRQS